MKYVPLMFILNDWDWGGLLRGPGDVLWLW